MCKAYFSHEIVLQEQNDCSVYIILIRFQEEIFESFINKIEKGGQMSVHLGVVDNKYLNKEC